MALRLLNFSKKVWYGSVQNAVVPKRGIVLSENGSVYDKPLRNRFGVMKTFIIVLPFLYFGATIGKEVSAFLEENDIFIPGDDDDD